ncbi:MAG: hypothetical protein HRU38_22035 [Saccharospirillaceae bacterium]|nr:hypothetical protein [Pseudomonadales bacterium]NRB81309.1 hypothetical protein [Saccharospirillaceae bacterium]
MNKSEFIEIINAPIQKTWDVLFNQYGDIQIHNPTMLSSNYLNGATKGELDCVRHCQFTDKYFVDEKITHIKANNCFTIKVTKHNLPFVNQMSATYELTSLSENVTELKMTSFNSFSPSFMKYMMRGQMSKSLLKHLFGLKYFVETGKTVGIKNYSDVFTNYQSI